jgi:hypothetical protein
VVASDNLLAHVAPLGWQHFGPTGDYVWTEVNPAAQFRPRREVRATLPYDFAPMGLPTHIGVEIGFQRVMRRHFMALATYLVQPNPSTLARGVVVLDAHSDGGADAGEDSGAVAGGGAH